MTFSLLCIQSFHTLYIYILDTHSFSEVSLPSLIKNMASQTRNNPFIPHNPIPALIIDSLDREWVEWDDSSFMGIFEEEEKDIVLLPETGEDDNLIDYWMRRQIPNWHPWMLLPYKPFTIRFMDLPGEVRNTIYEYWLRLQEGTYTHRHRGRFLVHPSQMEAMNKLADLLGCSVGEELRSYFIYSRRVGRFVWDADWDIDLLDLWKLQSGRSHRGTIYNAIINRSYEVVYTGVIGLVGVQDFLDSISCGDILAPKSAFRGKHKVNVNQFSGGEQVFSFGERVSWTSFQQPSIPTNSWDHFSQVQFRNVRWDDGILVGVPTHEE
jgi:hypothetical protein